MNTCKFCRIEYPKTNKNSSVRCGKCYYQQNREYIIQSKKKYKNTEQRKIIELKCDWKRRGLKYFGYTFDELYEYYKECNNCEICGKDLIKNKKCLDHCHQDGCFRWVLCQRCNTHDNWMKSYSSL